MKDIYLMVLTWGAEHDIHWYLFGLVLLLMPVWAYCWYKLGKDYRSFIRRKHSGE